MFKPISYFNGNINNKSNFSSLILLKLDPNLLLSPPPFLGHSGSRKSKMHVVVVIIIISSYKR